MVPQEEESKKGGLGGAGGTSAANYGLPRPQSSLELLSQTASVMEHSPQQSFSHSASNISIADLNYYKVGASASSNNNLTAAVSNSSSNSPKEAARGVTPTDLMAKRAPPALPDMSKKPQPVFLEQKHSSFLPAPLLGEGGPESNTDGGEGRAGTPLYYSPGLFLTYSNGSTANGGWNNNNHNSNAGQPSGPQLPPVASATSSGSSEQGGGGGGEAAVPNFLTSHGSFTSSGSLASAPYAFVSGSSASLSAMPPSAAFVPPPSQLKQNNSFMAPDDAQRENQFLRQQMAAKDATIDSLQKQVDMLQNEIRELRQLPTGKISQIPVE